MAKLSTNEIREMAKNIVAKAPGGVRFTDLVERISTAAPETPVNTIHGSVWDLARRFPTLIAKPSRGLFVAVQGAPQGNGEPTEPQDRPKAASCREEDFYKPFAEWLCVELDEATVSYPLGGASQREKWGTPDVVGLYKPLPWNLIKFDPEIIAAEIKIDAGAAVVAFGQAVAYRLFAAKSYIVMPRTISAADLSRLEALAMLFGIGFVLFDPNPQKPAFAIRVRAQRFPPDMFYVNEFADRLRQTNEGAFRHLFA